MQVGEEGETEGFLFPFFLFSAPPPALFSLATQARKIMVLYEVI